MNAKEAKDALRAAIQQNDNERVQSLLEDAKKSAILSDIFSDDDYFNSPFIKACWSQNAAIIQSFLEMAENNNLLIPLICNTPTMFSDPLQTVLDDALKRIIAQGLLVPLLQSREKGDTPIFMRAMYSKGFHDIVSKISSAADFMSLIQLSDSSGQTVLQQLLKNGDNDIIEVIVVAAKPFNQDAQVIEMLKEALSSEEILVSNSMKKTLQSYGIVVSQDIPKMITNLKGKLNPDIPFGLDKSVLLDPLNRYVHDALLHNNFGDDQKSLVDVILFLVEQDYFAPLFPYEDAPKIVETLASIFQSDTPESQQVFSYLLKQTQQYKAYDLINRIQDIMNQHGITLQSAIQPAVVSTAHDSPINVDNLSDAKIRLKTILAKNDAIFTQSQLPNILEQAKKNGFLSKLLFDGWRSIFKQVCESGDAATIKMVLDALKDNNLLLTWLQTKNKYGNPTFYDICMYENNATARVCVEAVKEAGNIQALFAQTDQYGNSTFLQILQYGSDKSVSLCMDAARSAGCLLPLLQQTDNYGYSVFITILMFGKEPEAKRMLENIKDPTMLIPLLEQEDEKHNSLLMRLFTSNKIANAKMLLEYLRDHHIAFDINKILVEGRSDLAFSPEMEQLIMAHGGEVTKIKKVMHESHMLAVSTDISLFLHASNDIAAPLKEYTSSPLGSKEQVAGLNFLRFVENLPEDTVDPKLHQSLIDAVRFNHNMIGADDATMQTNIETLMKDIDAKRPVFCNLGWDVHSVAAWFFNGYFIFTNRGADCNALPPFQEEAPYTTRIYKIGDDPEKIQNFFRALLRNKNMTSDVFLDSLKKMVQSWELVGAIKQKLQKVGNCTWANCKASLGVVLLLAEGEYIDALHSLGEIPSLTDWLQDPDNAAFAQNLWLDSAAYAKYKKITTETREKIIDEYVEQINADPQNARDAIAFFQSFLTQHIFDEKVNPRKKRFIEKIATALGKAQALLPWIQKTDENNGDMLDKAVASNNYENIKSILDLAQHGQCLMPLLTSQDNDGNVPIIRFIKSENLPAVRVLLKYIADHNITIDIKSLIMEKLSNYALSITNPMNQLLAEYDIVLPDAMLKHAFDLSTTSGAGRALQTTLENGDIDGIQEILQHTKQEVISEIFSGDTLNASFMTACREKKHVTIKMFLDCAKDNNLLVHFLSNSRTRDWWNVGSAEFEMILQYAKENNALLPVLQSYDQTGYAFFITVLYSENFPRLLEEITDPDLLLSLLQTTDPQHNSALDIVLRFNKRQIFEAIMATAKRLNSESVVLDRVKNTISVNEVLISAGVKSALKNYGISVSQDMSDYIKKLSDKMQAHPDDLGNLYAVSSYVIKLLLQDVIAEADKRPLLEGVALLMKYQVFYTSYTHKLLSIISTMPQANQRSLETILRCLCNNKDNDYITTRVHDIASRHNITLPDSDAFNANITFAVAKSVLNAAIDNNDIDTVQSTLARAKKANVLSEVFLDAWGDDAFQKACDKENIAAITSILAAAQESDLLVPLLTERVHVWAKSSPAVFESILNNVKAHGALLALLQSSNKFGGSFLTSFPSGEYFGRMLDEISTPEIFMDLVTKRDNIGTIFDAMFEENDVDVLSMVMTTAQKLKTDAAVVDVIKETIKTNKEILISKAMENLLQTYGISVSRDITQYIKHLSETIKTIPPESAGYSFIPLVLYVQTVLSQPTVSEEDKHILSEAIPFLTRHGAFYPTPEAAQKLADLMREPANAAALFPVENAPKPITAAFGSASDNKTKEVDTKQEKTPRKDL